jgi:hypothetical protein
MIVWIAYDMYSVLFAEGISTTVKTSCPSKVVAICTWQIVLDYKFENSIILLDLPINHLQQHSSPSISGLTIRAQVTSYEPWD